jgi:hypothetical protein
MPMYLVIKVRVIGFIFSTEVERASSGLIHRIVT